MERLFNTTGPIKNDIHYSVDPLQRWDLEQILQLINSQKYFILHAPRQTGKTSGLLALVEYLNAGGIYEAVYANIEAAQAAREDVTRSMKAIVGGIAANHLYYTKSDLLDQSWTGILERSGPDQALAALLQYWAQNTNKKVVLFLDEVDALVGDTLISLLRQIRSGYDKRPDSFPISIVLCGVRDVRDYRIHSSATKEIITGGSAFNIKAESLLLSNFTQEDIANLYQQHTTATGQQFAPEVFDLCWEYTAGQPWLVNALAHEVTYNMGENRDRSVVITGEKFEKAKERLILRRDTHLDQLTDKLREDRVRRVIQPILSGDSVLAEVHPDDIQYVMDLGLIAKKEDRNLAISNDIYREVIPRELVWSTQTMLSPPQQSWFTNPNGSLNMEKLLTNFQEFFREHSEHWIERFDYKEAGPQLLLQAFLQRIVNGGGMIDREYGLGRRRTDLFIRFPYSDGVQKVVLELKIVRKTIDATLAEGLEQTADYMDKCGTTDGYLILFDRSTERTWDDKIYTKTEQFQGKTIQVWGC
jgi:hypothetical protein